MILLDTNICIYIINARPPAVLARFQQYRMGDIGICSVVAAELAYGVAKSGSARNRQALEMFLAPLTVLPFDDAAARLERFAPYLAAVFPETAATGGIIESPVRPIPRMQKVLEERSGTPIGALDTMIAAHALSQHALLVTNNTREFAKVPGLLLDNWVDAA